MNAHSELVNQLLIALGTRSDLGRWWKNATGAIQSENGAYIRYGLEGSPDIVGLTAKGRWCGIEVKTGTGRQSKAQKNFEAMIIRFNGIYIVARDITSVLTELEQLVCS